MRVFPPSAGSARALQALQQTEGVAAVGFLGSGRASAALALANRVIGRRAFHGDDLEDAAPSPRRGAKKPVHASIHLYYDASRRCVFLLGLAHPVDPATGAVTFAGDGDALAPLGMAEAERERLKMQTLVLASCSLVFVLQRGARSSTHELKRLRALAAEKAQLVQWLAASSSTGAKGKRSGSSPSAAQVFAPGRCVPVAVFVVPATSDSLLSATIKTRPVGSATAASRSATAAHGKAVEARLAALFRSLRGGPVGSARLRDALTAASLSKERRVFTMDPSHSVVVVSRRALDGPETRLRDVLDALSISETESEVEDEEGGDYGVDDLLQSLDDDDDVGWPRATQYLQRLLDHLHALQTTGGAAKDAPSVRMELLPLAQWLKAFQGLAKLYQRMDSRRRSESAAAAGGADADREEQTGSR